jgi:5'-methylthioadenosine phosphorylase
MTNIRIGILGGTGLYNLDYLEDIKEVSPNTPFGKPSDNIVTGTIHGTPVAFLARHGRGHVYSPSEIPARANIFALKEMGIQRLISVSAVGSLRENIRPLDIVIPNQLIDRTKSRPSTFFDGGIVAHVSFAQPICEQMGGILYNGAMDNGATTHDSGTYVVIEGPQFSTISESHMYRSWGADIIGMTALPESKLAREAEMCYSILACTTDYDCWRTEETPVTVEMVIANLNKNSALSKSILTDIIPNIPIEQECGCQSALDNSIITDRERIAEEPKQKLWPLLKKYL